MNRICIISGCSRGIGREIALQLGKNGYSLGLLSRNVEALHSLQKQLIEQNMSENQRFLMEPCDIRDDTSVKESIEHIANELGNPDSLVNVAGINKDGLFVRFKQSDIHSLYETNVFGTMTVTRNVIPYMMRANFGSIVNIGSIVGEGGRVGMSVYASTKSALIGYSRSLAKELGRFKIRVNVVSPGFIKTEMTEKVLRENGEILKAVALGRAGHVDEVSNVVEFLLSDKASYVTGTTIRVDGCMEI